MKGLGAADLMGGCALVRHHVARAAAQLAGEVPSREGRGGV
jgi:hypothetical protein